MHHPAIYYALPMLMVAEASTASESWIITLLNYGVAGAMLVWFMWRDRLDRQERNTERAAQQKRHDENIVALRKIEDAQRTNTDLLIVGLAAVKTIDSGYSALLAKVKEQNTT